MKQLTILKVSFVEDNVIHIEGIEFICLSEVENAVLKDVLESEGFKSLEKST